MRALPPGSSGQPGARPAKHRPPPARVRRRHGADGCGILGTWAPLGRHGVTWRWRAEAQRRGCSVTEPTQEQRGAFTAGCPRRFLWLPVGGGGRSDRSMLPGGQGERTRASERLGLGGQLAYGLWSPLADQNHYLSHRLALQQSPSQGRVSGLVSRPWILHRAGRWTRGEAGAGTRPGRAGSVFLSTGPAGPSSPRLRQPLRRRRLRPIQGLC